MDYADVKFNPESLSERKLLILKAVVRDFIRSDQPVGSVSIVKNYLPEVSSATVRNELAALEGMGLIFQPHTSAGRIPTTAGYRIFINSLMEKKRLEAAEMIEIQNAMQQPAFRMGNILRDVTEVLSRITSTASLALSPRLSRAVIKAVRLLRLDSFNLVLIVFAEGDIVKHSHIKLEIPIGEELSARLSTALSREFSGVRMEDISEDSFIKIMSAFSSSPELVGKVLRLIIRAVEESAEVGVTLSGAEYIFDFKSLSGTDEAKQLYRMLSSGEEIGKIASKAKKDGVSVILGDETGDKRLSSLAVFIGRYAPDDTSILAAVAPENCDYEKICAALEYTCRHMMRLNRPGGGNKLILRRRGY